jgi:hypothetical protein
MFTAILVKGLNRLNERPSSFAALCHKKSELTPGLSLLRGAISLCSSSGRARSETLCPLTYNDTFLRFSEELPNHARDPLNLPVA